MHSSSTRRKAAFVPWLAALIFGATAHAGWLIHELRTDHLATPHAANDSKPVIIQVDARPQADTDPPKARPEAEPRARFRARTTPRCRHLLEACDEDTDELELWIHRTGRHTYTVDRRALDHFDLAAELPMWPFASALPGVELRNIQRCTPLFHLGLRNGDRVLAIARQAESELEHVEVTIERRGRPLVLVYDLA